MVHLISALLLVSLVPEATTNRDDLPTIETFTRAMVPAEGFVPWFWDASAGKLYMKVDRFDQEFLLQASLTAGLGSNPVGLDRSLPGPARLVSFQRVGRRVLLFQHNLRYRASSTDEAERRAVADSFARSVLFGFDAVAHDDTALLVDATAFVVRDAMGIANRLERNDQGRFGLDKSRSAPHLEACKAFPRNTELEAWLTFTSEKPGSEVRSTAPHPRSITLRVRQSLIELPANGYTPRRHDPRMGIGGPNFRDYSNPIDAAIETRGISRHRLKKKTPGAAPSEVVEPIVYYLDPGAPEPIRTALLEGARWWAEAFEKAGFVNAYRVELLPPDKDPADIRYNTIQWVHRATRGWSYGHTITDPRTGEIMKGHVALGSLRVRQDFLLAQGLLGAAARDGKGVEFALARLRQLAAHEVGHTLGLQHNFAASTYGRESVMDYPAPLVKLTAGEIDVSAAYDTGIGEWDAWSIEYGYAEFDASANERDELERIVQRGVADGLHYLTDQDARSSASAHPRAHLWDNGESPVHALLHTMEVRRKALAAFDGSALADGRPWAVLEEILVPLYLHHRYAVEACAKVLGGVVFDYAIKGRAGGSRWRAVPRHEQHSALAALLAALDPRELILSEEILALIPPRPPGHARHDELFPTRTRPMLDPISIAEVGAAVPLGMLLDPTRAARMQNLSVLHTGNLNFRDVLDAILNKVFEPASAEQPYLAAVHRAVLRVTITHLVRLLRDDRCALEVRALVDGALRNARERLRTNLTDTIHQVHNTFLIAELDRVLDRRLDALSLARPTLPDVPPGSPIGMGDPCFCGFQH